MRATKDDNFFQVLGLEENYSTLEENKLQEYFYKIAKTLFEEFQIAKGDTRYDFEELEFYLYTEKHKDNKHVYPRECKAGEWFVHYSGVDLTFETLQEDKKITQCGGILIRRIKEVGGASVGGPLRCLMELFNGQEDPKLVKKEHHEVVALKSSPRIGIKNDGVQDNRLYRFYIYEESQICTSYPQYVENSIEIKDKKYKYEPKYE